MHAELLSYPHISSYSVLLLAGFLAGYLVACPLAKRFHVERRHVDNLVLIFLVVGLAGGRFLSRLFYLPNVSFMEACKIWAGGGLVFYGGFIFAGLSLVIYSRLHRLPAFSLLDIFAPAAALGLGLGRIGCFLAGCCWGDLCVGPATTAQFRDPLLCYQVQTLPSLSSENFPFRVTFPKRSEAFREQVELGLITPDAKQSMPVHPAQLYEAALAFGIFGWLWSRAKRRQFCGEIFGLLGASYSVARFGVEFFRADNPPIYFGLTLSQVISLAIAMGCVAFWIVRRKERSNGQAKSVGIGREVSDVIELKF